MFDPVEDIKAFHEKYGLAYDGKPRALDDHLGHFRQKFMLEEMTEYSQAAEDTRYHIINKHYDGVALNLEEQLDALVDLVYVALGTAYLHGFDFREAWRRVHEANMRKVRAERVDQSKRGSTFDVVKPPGWVAPRHLDLVNDHAHRERQDEPCND